MRKELNSRDWTDSDDDAPASSNADLSELAGAVDALTKKVDALAAKK